MLPFPEQQFTFNLAFILLDFATSRPSPAVYEDSFYFCFCPPGVRGRVRIVIFLWHFNDFGLILARIRGNFDFDLKDGWADDVLGFYLIWPPRALVRPAADAPLPQDTVHLQPFFYILV